MPNLLSKDDLNNLVSCPYEFIGLTKDGSRAILRQGGNDLAEVYHLDEAACSKACEHARGEIQQQRLLAEMKRPTPDRWLAERQASAHRRAAVRALEQFRELENALSSIQEYKREHSTPTTTLAGLADGGIKPVITDPPKGKGPVLS